MAIRPLPISLAFSPNSRGRDPQSLTPAAFSLTTRTKMNWQERPPKGMARQFKPRSDARGGVGQGRMLMQEQTSLTRGAERRKRSAEPLPAAPSDSPSTVMALIERVALDPHADVEKLERLAGMYERLRAKEAELAFNGAKGRILKKLAGIKIVKNRPVLSELGNGKPQKGVIEAFRYAPLEEIDKHLRPLLAEEQMDLSYSDEPCDGG